MNSSKIRNIIDGFSSVNEELEFFESENSNEPEFVNINSKYEKDKIETKEGVDCYKFYDGSKLKEGEQPLGQVVGLENQKKEILSVIEWFNRSAEFKKSGVSIPKGILLFGEPGNGKTLIIREIIKCCGCPVFIFQGEQQNVVRGIYETFKKAREAGHSIIVFDELDLLISKEPRVVRALQECLDGVEITDDILVLTASNSFGDIPDALLRHGRIDKLIRIPLPRGDEALQLLKKCFKEFNLKFPDDCDEEELSLSLNGICCAGLKALVNDLILRNGFNDITSEMIDKSLFNVADRIKDRNEEENMQVAIHEAGHTVIANSYPQYFAISRLNISGGSGEFHAKEIDPNFWEYGKIIADIKISMAGVIAEKVICKSGSRGCTKDLQEARRDAYNLFNTIGYSSCWETLPIIRDGTRLETEIKRRRMERKIEHLLRKCERETTKFVKANKEMIIRLATILYEKKHLKSSEVLSCLNGETSKGSKDNEIN